MDEGEVELNVPATLVLCEMRGNDQTAASSGTCISFFGWYDETNSDEFSFLVFRLRMRRRNNPFLFPGIHFFTGDSCFCDIQTLGSTLFFLCATSVLSFFSCSSRQYTEEFASESGAALEGMSGKFDVTEHLAGACPRTHDPNSVFFGS
jgi:hypothetical protein